MSDHSERVSTEEDSFDALLARAARLTPVSAPSAAAAQLHPGTLLGHGRFRLLRRIGAGGMGVVFEAFDAERGTEVALKHLARVDATGIYRLKNEFRALADVAHPNLVRLHDLVSDGQLWFFSMELVRGRELDRWVRPKHHFEPSRLRQAFCQLAVGVQALHAAGKLHRDLKPSNVLVEQASGRVVILDFGLVTDPEAGDRGLRTRDTAAFGTPHYMAPEQAAGNAATRASDLYAFGVMLFEALTGKLPFDGRVLAILHRKQHHDAPRAKSIAEHVPDDLDELCAALLARDPSARPDIETCLRVLGATLASASAGDGAGRPSAAARPLPELVGRDDELAQLREAFAATREGTPTVVRITGESGIGKTALVDTFLNELRAAAASVTLSGRCYERESVPYKAFDRVIDELTRYLRALPAVQSAGLLPRDIGTLARMFPVLARCDAVAARTARPTDSAAEQRRRAFVALADLLAGMRDREPLVLYVDDLHWLDADSALLLEHLLDEADPPPVLWLLTERAGGDDALTSRVWQAARRNARITTREIALGPLAPAATLALAEQLLGREAAASGIAKEAAGNPFFALELAMASQRGQLGNAASAVTLAHAVIERVTHLGEAAAAFMSVLAVAARPTPTDVLVQAAGPWDDPHRALDALRSARLVHDAGHDAGRRCYDCYHDRIRAAIRGTLDEARLRTYHQKLAAAWSQRPDADPELLFTHSLGAGDREGAGRHALAAADKASASFAFGQAATLLAHAIDLLPDAHVKQQDLRTKRAEALSLAGRWGEAASAYRAAGEHMEDAAKRTELAFYSALHALGSGRGDTGLPALRTLFELSGVRWPRTRAGAFISGVVRLGWIALRAGRASWTRKRSTVDTLQLPDLRDLMRWLGSAGFVPAYDLSRGLYFMSVFISRALRSGDDAFVGIASAMLAAVLTALTPAAGRARALKQRALTLARAHRHGAIASATLSFVAYAELLDGHPRGTLELGIEAERLADGQGIAPAYPAWAARAAQAYALLWMGRLGDAGKVFDANARFARETGDELAAVGGDCALRHLATGDLAAANALMERKAKLLDSLGARGALRELYDRERIFCLLYEGRAEAALQSCSGGGGLVALFDPGMPVTLAALQGDPRGSKWTTRRRVARTQSRLRAQGPSVQTRAMVQQLAANRCLFSGDVQGALVALAQSQRAYVEGSMELHAALMQLRGAQLRSDAVAALTAEDDIRALGIADPSAWAGMLAPGLNSASAS